MEVCDGKDNNCDGQIDNGVVLPTVSITPAMPSLSCVAPSLSLTATATGESLTYRWDNQTTDRVRTVSVAGTYSVTVTAPNGCTASAQTTVGSNTSLEAPSLQVSALTTIDQPISVTASGCSGGTITWNLQGGTGQANGPVYTFTQPGSYSLSATCTLGSCISLPSSPLSLQILPAGLAITSVSMANCQLVNQAKGEYLVNFTPQYSGANTNPIAFAVINELSPTTAPAPYILRLYTDNPVITLVATQSGNPEARYAYHWLASCQSGTSPNRPPTTSGIPSQTILQGQAYQLTLPNYFTEPDGQALTFQATGLPAGLSLVGSLLSGTPSMTGVSNLTITALDPGGLSVSASFQLRVNPAPTTPGGFTMVGVSMVSCKVLSGGLRRLTFTPQYSGVSGAPISFSVVNELSPTTNAGPYSLNLYTDNPILTLKATQEGTAGEASLTYPWLNACTSNARAGVGEAANDLQVKVLGNPVAGQWVVVEIRGASDQAVQLDVVDLQGRLLHQQRIQQAASIERVSVPMGNRNGILLLTVSTASQRRQVKLLKP